MGGETKFRFCWICLTIPSDKYNRDLNFDSLNQERIINDLIKLLDSSKTNEEILNEDISYNVDRYKLSKTLTKNTMVQLNRKVTLISEE